MNRIINYWGIFAGICLCFASCNSDESDDNGIKGDPLTLTVSSDKVVLLPSNENDRAITFNWNKGIDRAPSDTITYIFRMDIANRDFETATLRDTITDFTKSFTAGELNELLVKHWKIDPSNGADIEARVVANIRGDKFVYPEIAIVKFSVMGYAPVSTP